MRLRAAFAAFVFFAALANGTTIVLPTDDQLIAKSPLIVIGTVLDSSAVDRNGSIYTITRVAVEQVLKGDAAPIIEIREIGGRVGTRFNVVFGSPEYVAGQRALLFLWPTGRGDFQTRDLFIGKFTERFTTAGERIWYRDVVAAGTHMLDGSLQPMEPRRIQRVAEPFTAYVSARIAGRIVPRNYEIDEPALIREPRIQPSFTLIAEPTVYRWFAFDNGGSASWVSVGAQPGYSNGGVSEVSTALNAWNTAPNAKIKFIYSGVNNSAPGGLNSPNGKNEILFNDPLGEIDGSWNPATGGVVGRGGFNNVQQGGSWTSGFAADPSHPLTTFASTGKIVEGNLVIQDGVAPNTGFSSTLLTAVLSHEFGHTLGIGHSADPTALMYASLQNGQNGSLRTDDQNAARWLYPATSSGGGPGTPPPPPPPPDSGAPVAPSNLTASYVNSMIQLNWTVNASNASAQAVYVAVANGAFEHAGDVAATRTWALLSSVTPGVTYRARVTAKNSSGESTPSNTVQITVPAQLSSDTLGLNATRFRVTLEARDPRTGREGIGRAIPQNDLFGYFSIPTLTGNASNPEVFVKLINGGAVNGKHWVFWGGLTDLEYTVRVTDSATGITRQYHKEAGSTCGGFDTSAFESMEVDPLAAEPIGHYVLIEGDDLVTDACSPGGDGICALSGRFRLTLSATDPRSGLSAHGKSLPQNDLFGYFSIPDLTGDSSNPEVFVKMIDGRGVNGKFWVFYGGLTDLEYRLTVLDTLTQETKLYVKPAGGTCGGFDTAAF